MFAILRNTTPDDTEDRAWHLVAFANDRDELRARLAVIDWQPTEYRILSTVTWIDPEQASARPDPDTVADAVVAAAERR